MRTPPANPRWHCPFCKKDNSGHWPQFPDKETLLEHIRTAHPEVTRR